MGNRQPSSANYQSERQPEKDLQKLATRLYYTCAASGIDLAVNWIPRAQNGKADEISKYVYHDDWQTTCKLFNLINLKWGPHTIHRFANAKNTKTACFNSHYWNPACEAVDAFTQNWTGETNWIVPPIRKLSATRGRVKQPES